jgi:hypothetical protein
MLEMNYRTRRHCYSAHGWDVELVALRSRGRQNYQAVFGLATDKEKDECEEGEAVEMGNAGGPLPQ